MQYVAELQVSDEDAYGFLKRTESGGFKDLALTENRDEDKVLLWTKRVFVSKLDLDKERRTSFPLGCSVTFTNHAASSDPAAAKLPGHNTLTCTRRYTGLTAAQA